MRGKALSEPGDWTLVKRLRNPWGVVPLTAGGRSLPEGARHYYARLLAQQAAPNPASRRHHYVPKAYLRQWAFDDRRVWALDTATGMVRALGLRDVCVEEDFYRVVGADGEAHNRVELLFGVVDAEIRRVQLLFDGLEDPGSLSFDDLIGLAASMAIQRMRTAQQRRLLLQFNQWYLAQDASASGIGDDVAKPYQAAGVHTELLFKSMWEAADVLSTRQIEIWDDPRGRFLTCDAPVLVPFRRGVRPGLLEAPLVIWPISPRRAVVLSDDLVGEKAVIVPASGRHVGQVRQAVYDGRERMIFASEGVHERLPVAKAFRRRTQVWLRCSDRTPTGEQLPEPGCCVERRECLAVGPDVQLCDGGLHREAPRMGAHA